MISTVRNYLLKHPKYNYQGELTLNTLVNDIQATNKDLVEYLQQNESIKNEFFPEVNGTTLFLQDHLIKIIRDIRITHYGFTEHMNAIGLVDRLDQESLLSSSGDVVLNFPYKDCILEGGMSKEEAYTAIDGKKERVKEIFLNEVVAKKEIRQLLSPKVLVDFTVHNKNGSKKATPKDITGAENLLIHGNNLLALHSLKEKYAGQVKLIYIDPPYNTGNDTFKYNDRFNHSSWLVFMKNRLEIARELLSDDGVIFVHCDEHEDAYLKVLMNEIFGRENFIGSLIRKTKSTTNDISTGLNIQHDTLWVFAKNKNNVALQGEEKTFNNYKNPDNDPNGAWVIADPSAARITEKDIYPIINPYTKKTDNPPTGCSWRFSKARLEEWIKTGKIVFKKEHKENERGFIFKRYQNEVKSLFHIINSLDFTDNKFMNQSSTKEMIALMGDKTFNYNKGEPLLERIISSASEEGDLVFDFFAGSGTTLAVAHKMGRRWIGIEQLEEHIDICKKRLDKVMSGEDQGGITKTVNWQDGGSFISCSLAKYNQTWKEQIQNSQTTEELLKLYEQMKTKSIVQHRVAKKNTNNEMTDQDFKKRSLEEQKVILTEVLDKNYLYIPLDHLEDDMMQGKITQEDIALNKKFYSC